MDKKEIGITPAYAGKSVRQSRTCGNGQDHPRLCGEKLQCFPEILQSPGSPPPMRGKGLTRVFDAMQERITPAYAGKRLVSDHRCSRKRDHPRLCGEKAAVMR